MTAAELLEDEDGVSAGETVFEASEGNGTIVDSGRRTAALVLNEYRLAVRSRWAAALTAIFALFSLLILTFSGASVGPAGFERIVASLVNLAVYLLPLAALVFGYDAVVGHEDSGWLDVLFALPISRSQVVIGTFIGRGIVLVGATAIGFGVSLPFLVRDFGASVIPTFGFFVFAAIGVALAFFAIAVLVSSVVSEKVYALGGVLLVWVWFTLIHDLLALGFVAAFDLPSGAIVSMIVSNPADVFRVLALSRLEVGGGAGFAAVIAQTDLSMNTLLASLGAWIVLPTALAAVLIRRRRL
ncbi:ABC transporter permease [Natronomonas sp. LN261]|jgi:Cu-processing system permease protein|uniref:ABC transporter permease n=1 Tax=Natronomonas sp. LN261 TaxID=2750669 RepID=UPI0015EED962|nr:ABC transporter permease subunit [Natronomonas sp. LN261]